MDLDDLDFFRAALALADRLGGTLNIDSASVLNIRLPADGPNADVLAAGITADDFPFTYLIPADDSTLVFEV